MNVWLARHLQTLIGSLGRLSRQKLATLMTTLVIGVALALPACLHLLVLNAQAAAGGWVRTLDMSVFLKRPTATAEAQRIVERLRQRRDVATVEFIPADEALKQFRRNSGFGAALDALAQNPLPHTLVVRPAPGYTSPAHLEALAAELRANPSVDAVQLDSAWMNRLDAILQAITRALLLTAGVLALGVLVIIGNTIRLDIQNRRDEIEIVKLVGASDAFVRRPFLYTGVWYGLLGALLAWVLAAIVLAALREPISRLAGLYDSGFQVHGLGWRDSLVLLATGVGLGWLGSFISATRHLRAIEPS